MEQTNLGDYIKGNREQRGLSIRGLARDANVDATWLSKVERGIVASPDPRLLWRVARVLDIETADL
jgi:transcriptional regulator with XRE-family HTH domain